MIMKKKITLLCFLACILYACKTDVKESKEDPIVVSEEVTTENTEPEEEPEIDMGDLMNVMGGLLNPSVSQDTTSQGLFTASGALNIAFLKRKASHYARLLPRLQESRRRR